ncbi:unnamed protein product [Porites evermanni]|uniref:Uncharacterized protein n=1 Tax=Porites evermanni TaxID=104178 RepID=A0ABN8NBL0_9CNID|nr:unnamed protein product [Porites evermanni]
MVSERGREWRNKVLVTCSPDKSTETETRENLPALDKKGDEEKLDTGSAFKTFGNENIADNFESEIPISLTTFEKEGIDGKILLSTAVQSIRAMEQLGLTMIANQRASVSAPSVGKKGKLTPPDVRCLDPARKSIYLTV